MQAATARAPCLLRRGSGLAAHGGLSQPALCLDWVPSSLLVLVLLMVLAPHFLLVLVPLLLLLLYMWR